MEPGSWSRNKAWTAPTNRQTLATLLVKIWEVAFLMLTDSYYFFCGLALILGTILYAYLALKAHRNPKEIFKIWAVALISSIFGAKIFHTLFEAEGHLLPSGEIARDAWDLLCADPWHWARVFSPGYVLLGGLLFGSIFVFLALRIGNTAKPFQYADFFAPALALGLAVGRLGCFFAGCCYGQPTDISFFSVTYTGSLAELGPLLAVQLIESGFACILFLYLITRDRSGKDGTIFILFIAPYLAFRCIIEFFRYDIERGIWLWGLLSTSQILSIMVLILGALYYWIEITRTSRANLR